MTLAKTDGPGMAYVGFLPCGCCVAAVSCRLPRRELAKEIAAFVRRGYRVAPKSVAWVRENLRECTHKAKQGEFAL